MSISRIFLLFLLLVFPAHFALAAPPVRPFAGIGILFMHPHPFKPESPRLTIYKDRGLERLAEVDQGKLPGLAPAIRPVGVPAAAVVDKRGTWVKIVYDDAGRAGWVALEQAWEFLDWQDYLVGLSVTVIPGVKKDSYAIRPLPDESTAAVGSANGAPLRVLEVRGDWASIASSRGNLSGWLRWRDGDGRFLVTADSVSPQNR